MAHEDILIAAKTAPPAAVTGATLWGVALADWVLWLTLIYTIGQVFVLARDKFYRPWKEKRNGRNRQDPGRTA